MLPQRLRVLLGPQFVQELGRALHVGEEEGDRSRGEFGSHRVMMRQMKILRPGSERVVGAVTPSAPRFSQLAACPQSGRAGQAAIPSGHPVSLCA